MTLPKLQRTGTNIRRRHREITSIISSYRTCPVPDTCGPTSTTATATALHHTRTSTFTLTTATTRTSPPTASVFFSPTPTSIPSFSFFRSFVTSNSTSTLDPTAKRPTKACDPYGQGGKPLSLLDASGLLKTLDDGWTLQQKPHHRAQSTTSAPEPAPPQSICKEFYHDNFMTGSRFVSHVAAVAHNNNHYPTITLERRLMKREKAWRVVSAVNCFTPTLGGLSYNDFHLAMLIDVEVARREVADLLLEDYESLKKHT